MRVLSRDKQKRSGPMRILLGEEANSGWTMENALERGTKQQSEGTRAIITNSGVDH